MRKIALAVMALAPMFLLVLAAGIAAADIPDAPLEPAIESSEEQGMTPGSILEFWFAPVGRFERMPVEPSVTGMVDDSDKVFAGNTMLKDPEMKNYSGRHGVLQWTTYYKAKTAGKHVFAIGAEGMWSDDARFGGVSMLVNDEQKVVAIPGRDESATVDFAQPGLYKLQIRMWWTHGSRKGPLFQDYRVNLKVREPGSLGLRQVTKKDLFYKMPE